MGAARGRGDGPLRPGGREVPLMVLANKADLVQGGGDGTSHHQGEGGSNEGWDESGTHTWRDNVEVTSETDPQMPEK